MSRLLTDHIVNPANDKLTVEVFDHPGHGGACHSYWIAGFTTLGNPACPLRSRNTYATSVSLVFQNGPIAEVGVNGITHEALLAILADRLRGFQSGPFACAENAEALAHIEAAQSILKSRTLARMARGVEGTNVK